MLVVGIGRELSCALVAALAPWKLDVYSTAEENPGPSMPSTSAAAREMASRHDARAVVWLASDLGGHALWVYDAAEDRTVARAVPSPPFSASVAASLALSVKTTVRMVGVIRERAPEPPAPARDVAPEAPGEVESPVSPAWRLGVRLGIRFGPFKQAEPDARYGVELRFVPSGSWWASRTEAWASLGLESGEWYDARVPGLEGRIADPAASLTLGATFPLTERLWLGVSQGVALHYVRISGVLLDEAVRVTHHRFDAVLSSRLELELLLGSTRLILSGCGAYWTQWQAFELPDDTAVTMGPFSLQASAAVRVALR